MSFIHLSEVDHDYIYGQTFFNFGNLPFCANYGEESFAIFFKEDAEYLCTVNTMAELKSKVHQASLNWFNGQVMAIGGHDAIAKVWDKLDTVCYCSEKVVLTAMQTLDTTKFLEVLEELVRLCQPVD